MLMHFKNIETADLESLLAQEDLSLTQLVRDYPSVTVLLLEHFRILSNPASHHRHTLYQRSYHLIIQAIDSNWDLIAKDHKAAMLMAIDKDKVDHFFIKSRIKQLDLNLELCPRPFKERFIQLLNSIAKNLTLLDNDDTVNVLMLYFKKLREGHLEWQQSIDLLIQSFTISSQLRWDRLFFLLTAAPSPEEALKRFNLLLAWVKKLNFSALDRQKFLWIIIQQAVPSTLALSTADIFNQQDFDLEVLKTLYAESLMLTEELQEAEQVLLDQILTAIDESKNDWREPLNPTSFFPSIYQTSSDINQGLPDPFAVIQAECERIVPVNINALVNSVPVVAAVGAASVTGGIIAGVGLLLQHYYKKLNAVTLNALGYKPYDLIRAEFVEYWYRCHPAENASTYSHFRACIDEVLIHHADKQGIHLKMLPQRLEDDFMKFKLPPSLQRIRQLFLPAITVMPNIRPIITSSVLTDERYQERSDEITQCDFVMKV
jgi:hypothetical protein